MEIKLIRTTPDHPDFSKLIQGLDAYLREMDGDEHPFYAQYNTTTQITQVVLAYIGHEPVGCGAIKAFDPSRMEIKRMFVAHGFRNRGVASQVLHELEQWAAESGAVTCILETGKRQTEAIALYGKSGYSITENFGPYQGVANSICMSKPVG